MKVIRLNKLNAVEIVLLESLDEYGEALKTHMDLPCFTKDELQIIEGVRDPIRCMRDIIRVKSKFSGWLLDKNMKYAIGDTIIYLTVASELPDYSMYLAAKNGLAFYSPDEIAYLSEFENSKDLLTEVTKYKINIGGTIALGD